MGLMDDLTVALEKVASEAEKAIYQGKVKVEQLQWERQMDAAARKVGYMELDRYRGRPVDDGARAELIYEMARLEEQIQSAQASAGTSGGAADGAAGGAADAPEQAPTAAPGSATDQAAGGGESSAAGPEGWPGPGTGSAPEGGPTQGGGSA